MKRFQEIWENWDATHDNKYKELAFNQLKPKIDNDIKNIYNIPKSALEAQYADAVYRAFDNYDPKKGTFKTYLFHHIKSANRFAYENRYDLYLPEMKAQRANLFNETYKKFASKYEREPSAIELADELGWDIRDVEEFFRLKHKSTYALEGAAHVRQNKDMEYIIEMLYYSVNKREQLILEYIFGMHGKPALSTNVDIAKRTGLSINVVKKIRSKLFDKIKKAIA